MLVMCFVKIKSIAKHRNICYNPLLTKGSKGGRGDSLGFWKKKPQADAGGGAGFEAAKDALGRIEIKQKEMSMQMDDITDILQDILQDGTDAAADAATHLFGMIFDFCAYCEDGGDDMLIEQAQVMQREAAKIMDRAGFRVIEPRCGLPFDVNLHTADSAENKAGLPDGVIVRVLSPGFVRGDKILRRAAVVVNRNGGE